MTDYSGQIKETKKGYSLTTDDTPNENINITNFLPEKKKKITVNLNNGGANNVYRSSYFDETITINNGDYTMMLFGNGSKTVNLGSASMTDVQLSNNGKNKVTAGNGGNSFKFLNINAKNTVTAGTGDDTYIIQKGTNKITDKGGVNTYDILDKYSNNTIISGKGKDTYTIVGHGVNNITDKGGDNTFTVSGVHSYGKFTTGSGKDTFDITVSSMDGDLKINSGAGIDTLKIHNVVDNDHITRITADLGNDNDIVEVDYKGGVSDVTFTNIKTGKGEDTVTISAGIENIIDTGKDADAVTISGGNKNYIYSGDSADTITVAEGTSSATTTTIIKAGKGDDTITANDGRNIIYGEKGEDNITLNDGINTVYGGGDTITAADGNNTIYANADKKITLTGGVNTVNISKDKNTIDVTGGTQNTINLNKGNNTVNVTGGTSEDYIKATVNISAGKNTVNIDGYSISTLVSTTKTTQTLNIKDNAFCGVTLGNGNDIIHNSSTSDDQNKIKAGGGNDRFYISAGSKEAYGEAGNDYFELSGGSGHNVKGGDGKDTFDIKIGNDDTSTIDGEDGDDTFNVKSGQNTIDGGAGKDTFNIEGGKSTINAGDGNDIINLTDGNQNKVYANGGDDIFNVSGGHGNYLHGDVGNDTFNITSGYANYIYGEDGSDIYNLNMKSEGDSAFITDISGDNRVNVSKNYNGLAWVHGFTGSNDTLSFDKSYKLTNASNVKTDGSLNTTNSNITLYVNYTKSSQTFATDETMLVKNVKDEISDKAFSEHSIQIDSTIETFSFGGKNYTLDLNALKQDLASWFSTHDAAYTDSASVFANEKTAGDIQSLMAVYTEHTADCFTRV